MTEQFYTGLKAIAARVECSRAILIYWIRYEGFPAKQIGTGPYRATERNIVEWMDKKTKALPEEG